MIIYYYLSRIYCGKGNLKKAKKYYELADKLNNTLNLRIRSKSKKFREFILCDDPIERLELKKISNIHMKVSDFAR